MTVGSDDSGVSKSIDFSSVSKAFAMTLFLLKSGLIVGIYALIGIGRLDASLVAGFAEAVIGWRKFESPVKTDFD